MVQKIKCEIIRIPRLKQKKNLIKIVHLILLLDLDRLVAKQITLTYIAHL